MKTNGHVAPKIIKNSGGNEVKVTVDENVIGENVDEDEKLILSKKEAKAASPEYMAACGEEDPGAGLESLITPDERHDGEKS